MKKAVKLFLFCLLLVPIVRASERAVNAYRTHKISSNVLLVQCNDEREPVVKKFENTTMVMVSCQSVPDQK